MIRGDLKHVLLASVVALLLAQGHSQTPSSYVSKFNVSYGSDPAQIMDIYIPESNEAPVSRVIVLIHGGSWSGGDKSEMDDFLDFLQTGLPNYPIANINYRLGNSSSPGYPKQLEDVDLALQFLESEFQMKAPEFALMGVSAGAHLSMLYAYGFDTNATVEAVVDIVGPADFLDPLYCLSPYYNKILFSFIGPYYFAQNPIIYGKTAPATHISPRSPATIFFYGMNDPLVPATQGPRLKLALALNGVPNEANYFEGGHYYNWAESDKLLMRNKIVDFLTLRL